ncbi:hypothetical protein GC167_10385 [bacterium]|nr:hypothetical protein [bacterium]
MKSTLFWTAFVLGALLSACGPQSEPSTKERTASVDSLPNPDFWLDSAQFYIGQTPFEELIALEAEISAHYAWFQTEYTDTRDRDFWIVELSKLERVNKAVLRAKRDREALPSALQLGQKQWEDWQKAHAQKEFEGDLGQRYLEDERRAANDLYRKARFRHNETVSCLEIWPSLKPLLDSTRSAFENPS